MRRIGLLLLAPLWVGCVNVAPKMLEDTMPEKMDNAYEPMRWDQVLSLEAPPSGDRIAYGDSPEQFGILRLPESPAFAPMVVLIHGGCWLVDYDLQYFEHWADWFTQRGYATWNIEYRRLGNEGGGWPGSFTDVAKAIDHLRTLQSDYDFDLEPLIFVGHSAGATLALWAASRSRLHSSSELWQANPLLPKQVIGLAPISNLERYREGPAGTCHSAVDPLIGGDPMRHPQRYEQSSPSQRLPLGVPIALIAGEDDPIVAVESVEEFARAAENAGDAVDFLSLSGLGHFDTGIPTRPSVQALSRVLGARK